MSCTFNCTQGRRCTCTETVDSGLPIQMYEGTLDEPIRRVNVIATLFWFVASAVLVGLAIAVYGAFLS